MEPSQNHDAGARPPATTGVITYLFLTISPFLFLVDWVHELPTNTFWSLVTIVAVLYVRTALDTASRKLLNRKSKGRRNFKGSIDEETLTSLQDSLMSNAERMTVDQVRYFALSVLAPQVIRRRVTDEYTPGRRTLTKSVTVELDLYHQYVNGAGPTNDDLFIALTLPRKGALYDQLRTSDCSGKLLPSLSHREYRELAARTLRTLLQSALPDGKLTNEAVSAEKLALTEILRFSRVVRDENETDREFIRRDVEQDAKRKAAFAAIKALGDDDNHYLKLAVEFTAKLSTHYAIVVVVPTNGSARSIVTYSRVIIPDLCLANLTSREGIRDRLRMALGLRPSSLTISARNAASCHSYHLIVAASSDLFLGDFDTSSVLRIQRTDEPRLEPYWRVRGRRGQNYFHLYGRSLVSSDKDLNVSMHFHEIPPGSVGRAFTAALTTCLVVLLVGFLSYAAVDLGGVDSQVASFLLAVPGLAAAWMGFETRPDQLFEGTVISRLSLVSTFILSFSASVMLMLNKSGLVVPTGHEIFFFGKTDVWWSILGFLATLHMITMGSIWWLRNRVYRSLTTRPVGDSAVIA
ncbi:hypothetical protein [Umezawaea sp.]|uniref:hypothetical protein n=1 Tax=Umezawaea sp. TaxID=1955258 RepID=UPI002ED3A5F7